MHSLPKSPRPRSGTIGPVLLLAILLCLPAAALGSGLRVATVNVWSGLDYRGVRRVGEYEPAGQRERRFQALLTELRETGPDLIALQEANPVHRMAGRLADSLGFDCVSQRTNSGLKIGPFGVPRNLNEGLAILARKDLRLRLVDVWLLAGASGVIGNSLSFHWAEANIALLARVQISGRDLYVADVHLPASVPDDSTSRAALRAILEHGGKSASEGTAAFARLTRRARRQQEEASRLCQRLKERCPDRPLLLLGDFNATPESETVHSLLARGSLLDAAGIVGLGHLPTWDAGTNPNIRYSTETVDGKGRPLEPLDLLSAWYDGRPRRIDYVFLSPAFAAEDVRSVRPLCAAPGDGVWASDHYGVMAELDLSRIIRQRDPASFGRPRTKAKVEPLPIVSYDSDTGFGYGAKVFLLGLFGRDESFDLVAFNSTKGERWCRLVASIPDCELRQGTVYPLAVDLVLDYDRYLRNSFFGVGSGSRFADREFYQREPIEASLAVSRGFTAASVGTIGLRAKTVRNARFAEESRLRDLPPALNASRATYVSGFLAYRHDTRDSYVDPSRGTVLQGELEHAPPSVFTNVRLTRFGGRLQHYSVLFYPKTVLALRLGVQGLSGKDLPVQVLLPVGGNQTLRGSPQDRYLDRSALVMNAELRFPLWRRLGGVAGLDAGRVLDSSRDLSLRPWPASPVIGLRFHMDTFIIRLDLGFGRETTGFYLNFGQLF